MPSVGNGLGCGYHAIERRAKVQVERGLQHYGMHSPDGRQIIGRLTGGRHASRQVPPTPPRPPSPMSEDPTRRGEERLGKYGARRFISQVYGW